MLTSRLVSAALAALALAACTPDEPPEPEGDAPTVDAPEAFTPEDVEETPDGLRLDVPVELVEVADLDGPTAGAVGPDGVLHIAERAGTVHPIGEDGAGAPVIDVSDETTTDGERGLLGLAFADDGGELYLSFTDADGHTVVDAVTVEDGEVRADERRRIFTVEQPYRNHNGGDLQIGPEGLLYLGLGDGGGGGDPLEAGQDLGTPLGALLRIDPRAAEPYGVPDDNPFVEEEDAAGEIYAFGLRNPWRFSFDRGTGELWIADVGQDAREEINAVTLEEAAGANFGWNLMEGTLEFAGEEPADHVRPVHEYETSSERCAVTGGYVYRGQALPELQGAYIFSDYCEGALRAIVLEDGEVAEEAQLDVGAGSVVSFAQDAEGELYVLDLEGAVLRLEPAA